MNLKPMHIGYVIDGNKLMVDRDKNAVKLMEKLNIDESWFEPMFYHILGNIKKVDAREKKETKEYSHLLTDISFAFDGDSKNPKLKLVESPSSRCMLMRQKYPEFDEVFTALLEELTEVMDKFNDQIADWLKEVNDEFNKHKGEQLIVG